jgi:glycerophosphoryl diester phosphodiesterase
VLVQVLAAAIDIGAALWIAREYELARGAGANVAASDITDGRPAPGAKHARWQARLALGALVILGPTVSAIWAVVMADALVDARPVRVTAHRAGPNPAPENSLAALRLAMAARADCVEIDVQLTADGHVVLLHDRDLKRVTGDPRELNDVNLEELQKLRLRTSAGSTDERAPTLGEFLAACDGRIRLNVELKEPARHPGLAVEVVRVLREHEFLSRAGLSCFDLAPLLEARAAEPRLSIGAILAAAKGDITRLPVDFLSLNQRMARGDVVRRAHQHGMDVHVWTVNDRAAALRSLDLGCDNLITSDPKLMRQVVDEYSALTDAERVLLRLRRWMRE